MTPVDVPVPLCKISAVEVSELQKSLWRESSKVAQRNQKREEDSHWSPGEVIRGEVKGMSHSRNYCRGFLESYFDAFAKGRQRKRGECKDCKIHCSHGRSEVRKSLLSSG